MSGVVQSIGVPQTWTPSFTGFLVDPSSVVARYTLIGKVCFFSIATNTPGTSNSTVFTITLPFQSRNASQRGLGQIFNNGSYGTSPGLLKTRANSNIADLYINTTEGTWNAANFGKACFFTGCYEIL